MVPSQFSARDRVHLIFPGALGDFLCFGAALGGLRSATAAHLQVVGRSSLLELLDPSLRAGSSVDGRAVAELFAGGPLDAARAEFGDSTAVYSWTGHSLEVAARLRALGVPVVRSFAFRDFAAGEHAAEYYARCLGVSPAPPPLRLHPAAEAWAAAELRRLRAPRLVIHAGSGSPRKNWSGFDSVARWWRDRGGAVVELQGPAEEGQAGLPADLLAREGLPRVAALLRQASVYLGNDSGITHLAGAVGARGLALFAADELPHWQPRSERLRVLVAEPSCAVCDPPHLCLHRLPLERVLGALG